MTTAKPETCAELRCDRPGKPEPATRDHFDYRTKTIDQTPNTSYGDPIAGKTYCGTHSPSRKAAREAAKELAESQLRAEQERVRTDGKARAEQKVKDAMSVLAMLVHRGTEEERVAQMMALNTLENMALDAARTNPARWSF